ncbi:MAG: ribosome assembly factor SBDS [Thermoplasmata archaeon]|nr:MAG: ribosome assembly factor SBDS [Thermoplasmata archaeon]
MVSLDDAVIARYDVQGERFEVLVDPESAQKLKEGEEIDLNEKLAIDTIFKDSNKGDRASEDKLNKIFNTNDVLEIAKEIILKGEIQLTTDQRRKLLEEKRKQIIDSISQNAINPQTKTPHPPQRIDLAMKEAKVNIDPFKAVDIQVQDVLKALQPILPIRFEKVVIAIKLSATDSAKVFRDIKNMGKITKEEWQKDGSWIALVEIPAGLQESFFEVMNNKTRGNVELKLIE